MRIRACFKLLQSTLKFMLDILLIGIEDKDSANNKCSQIVK